MHPAGEAHNGADVLEAKRATEVGTLRGGQRRLSHSCSVRKGCARGARRTAAAIRCLTRDPDVLHGTRERAPSTGGMAPGAIHSFVRAQGSHASWKASVRAGPSVAPCLSGGPGSTKLNLMRRMTFAARAAPPAPSPPTSPHR